MRKKLALQIIMVISFAGILFSGFLSYRELFLQNCQWGFIRCGVNTPPVAGIPACVLGFVMYAIVFAISFLGYRSKI